MLSKPSPRSTTSPPRARLASLSCLLLAMTLSACGSLSVASKPPQPLPPLPQPAVLTTDSPSSRSYSTRARAWLKKARELLTSFETSETPSQPPTESQSHEQHQRHP